MTKQYFITIEGPDGAGKTSLLNEILPELEAKYGQRLIETREPGGKDNRIAEAIRNLALDHTEFTEMDDRTEALLFAASRRQHVIQTILPALNNNKIVISDRYLDSSIAYQGGGRGIGADLIEEMNQFATEGLQPGLTLLIDVPSEVGLRRIAANRTDKIDRLDNADLLPMHQKTRQAYLDLAKKYPERIKVLDGQKNTSELKSESIELIYKFLEDFK